MLWIYSRYQYFNSFSARTVFICQNLSTHFLHCMAYLNSLGLLSILICFIYSYQSSIYKEHDRTGATLVLLNQLQGEQLTALLAISRNEILKLIRPKKIALVVFTRLESSMRPRNFQQSIS